MGEKLKNAPVYFTIAQAKHNPVLKLGAYAADIQERMRKVGYPDYRRRVAIAFSFVENSGSTSEAPLLPVPEQVDRLVFVSADNSRAFIVEQNALSFQTAEYDTFEAFADEFIKGLSIVHECVTLAYSERVGLRYLDAVTPPNGEAGLADYLIPGVLGINSKLPSGATVSHTMCETYFQTEGSSVLARVAIQGGPLGFPMDLQQIDVKIADRFKSINGVHAVLDTDASVEGRHPFELGAIKAQLKALRRGIGFAFDATVTPAAIAAWKT